MRHAWSLLVLAGILAVAGTAAAQTGVIEFTARAVPTAGRAEPAMELPFYLLRKSFAEIQKEADAAEPKPDLDRFIEGLDVSKELKEWMKRTRVVQLRSAEFVRKLIADDLFAVTEFFEAYITRNAGDAVSGFPAPKYKDSDKKDNPQRYERQVKEYREQVRRFLGANPQSLSGIEMELAGVDPGPRWLRQESERRQRVRLRALDLAETRYLVAKTQTNLEGRASLAGILPGNYWLTTLESEAAAGDVRLRWDVPVTVYAGATSRLQLSNLNAVPPKTSR